MIRPRLGERGSSVAMSRDLPTVAVDFLGLGQSGAPLRSSTGNCVVLDQSTKRPWNSSGCGGGGGGGGSVGGGRGEGRIWPSSSSSLGMAGGHGGRGSSSKGSATWSVVTGGGDGTRTGKRDGREDRVEIIGEHERRMMDGDRVEMVAGGSRTEAHHHHRASGVDSFKQIEELTDCDIQHLSREECQRYLLGMRRAPTTSSVVGTSLEELTDATLKQRVREERRYNHHAKERPAVKDRPLEDLTDADIRELTREECRRYLKEKGMRKPSWNKAQAMQQLLSLKGLLPIASNGGSICIPATTSSGASPPHINGRLTMENRSSNTSAPTLPPFPILPPNFSPPIFFPVPCLDNPSISATAGGGGGGGGDVGGYGRQQQQQQQHVREQQQQATAERRTAALLLDERMTRGAPDRNSVTPPSGREGRLTYSSRESVVGDGVGDGNSGVGGGLREMADDDASRRSRSTLRLELPSLNSTPPVDTLDSDDASLSLSMR